MYTPRSSSGHTLLELVVVLTIVSLTAAIGAPHVSSAMSRYRAELAARQIVADLNLARETAKSTSASQMVTFNVPASSYTITGVASLDGRSPNYTVNLSTGPYQCAIISADFNGTTQVTFDAYGSADQAGKVIVQCAGIQNSVTLEPTTGKASVP